MFVIWHLLDFVLACSLFNFVKVLFFFFQVLVCQLFIRLVKPHVVSDCLTILVEVSEHF
jgi:hypothetical protein